MENIWAQADSGHHKMFRPRWHHPCVENKHQVEKTKMKKKQAQKLLLDLLLLTTSMNAGERKKKKVSSPTSGNQNYFWHCSVPEVILVP